MSYGRSAMYGRLQAGDPFLGGLVKGIGSVIGGVAKVAAPVVGGLIGGPVGAGVGFLARRLGGAGPSIQAPAMPGGAMPLVKQGQYAGPGLIPVLKKKRRRMNYANQKALRRSLRRVTGYARQQKAVRKAAQEFAREFGPKRRARRDVIVPRHTRVR